MSEIKNNGQANGLFHCRNLSYLNSRIENSIDRLEIKWDKFLHEIGHLSAEMGHLSAK